MSKLLTRTATLSQSGGRPYNEDTVGYQEGCWVVADGLGGHGGGDVASKLAVDSLLQQANPTPPLDAEGMIQAIMVAEQVICQQQQTEPRLSRMRTTVVMLCSDGHKALWTHVGDSRLYHLRQGRVCTHTRDHSVPQAMANAGEIAQADVRFHEDRNRLLRSLGGEQNRPATVTKVPVILEPGDVFLLCSDGFWEYVSEDAMEATLSKVKAPQHWLGAMNKELLTHAPARHDNYSALAVFFERKRWLRFS